MKLYKLNFGKSKKKMRPIMIDSLEKCKAYKDAREKSKVIGWHDIVPAENGEDIWRKKTTTIGGNSVTLVPRVGKGRNGYISKHGFQEHT